MHNRVCTKDNLETFDKRAKSYLFKVYANLNKKIVNNPNKFNYDLQIIDNSSQVKHRIEVQISRLYAILYGDSYKELEGKTCIDIYDRKLAYLKGGHDIEFFCFSYDGGCFRSIILNEKKMNKYKKINIITKEFPETGEPVWLVLLEDWSPIMYMKDYL